MIRFIGDVHGKFDRYKDIALGSGQSVQVGDFGAGFLPVPEMDVCHRFIRGNHDSPDVCRNIPNWIKDGYTEVVDGCKIMYVGGALSIDRHNRIQGVDWWPDEELPIGVLNYDIFDVYESFKPDIMVTHDCPEGYVHELFPRYTSKAQDQSRTRQAFDGYIGVHKPNMWIFGHWHMSVDKIVDSTRFICLAELEYKDL